MEHGNIKKVTTLSNIKKEIEDLSQNFFKKVIMEETRTKYKFKSKKNLLNSLH